MPMHNLFNVYMTSYTTDFTSHRQRKWLYLEYVKKSLQNSVIQKQNHQWEKRVKILNTHFTKNIYINDIQEQEQKF